MQDRQDPLEDSTVIRLLEENLRAWDRVQAAIKNSSGNTGVLCSFVDPASQNFKVTCPSYLLTPFLVLLQPHASPGPIAAQA